MFTRAVLLMLAVLAFHIQPARADWVSAGPIWSDADARHKCPGVCGRDRWDGNWKTVEMGRNSVCRCSGYGGGNWGVLDRPGQRICVETEAIRNRLEANMRCPGACGSGKWDGSWRRMNRERATCGCVWRSPRIFDPI